ncbi:MAG TPA: hypothetical protein VGM73_09035 [Candidatus Didemnitutus sp.]|jgi:hypothetical protein
MTLFLATLLPGIFLALLGVLLLWNGPRVERTARSLPRSTGAAWVFFGGGVVWFLWRISRLGDADLIFFQTPTFVMLAFGLLAVLSFIYAPDFLAVRGLSLLMLLVAEPLIFAAYMEWTHPWRRLMVAEVYAGLALALYLAAAPYRLRDFFDWLFQRPKRARLIGTALLAFGLATVGSAFTY